MNRSITILILVGVLLLTGVAVTIAADVVGLSSSVVPGGGGTSTGGSFTVNGSVGQSAVSTSTGGSYSVAGGYWTSQPSETESESRVFLPFIQR